MKPLFSPPVYRFFRSVRRAWHALPPFPRLPSFFEIRRWLRRTVRDTDFVKPPSPRELARKIRDIELPAIKGPPSPSEIRSWWRELRHTRLLPPPPKIPTPKAVWARMQNRPPSEWREQNVPIPSPADLIESFQEQPKNRKRIILVILFLLVAAGAAAPFVGPKASRQVKAWQARRLSQLASAHVDREEWRAASKNLQDSFQLAPMEKEVWRAYARLLTRTGQGTFAVEWWQKVQKDLLLSKKDHRDYAAAALSARELGIAAEQVAHLLQKPEEIAPEDLVLASQLTTLRGYNRTAIEYAQKVLEDGRSTSKEHFTANILLIANSRAESPDYHTALARVVDTARQESDPASAQALAFLAQQKTPARLTTPSIAAMDIILPSEETTQMSLKEIADRLDTNRNSKPYQLMLALELRSRSNPNEEKDLIHKAVEAYGKGDDETLIALGSWLYSHGQFESLLRVIPLQRALQRRELLMERIDALAALNKLTEVRDLLLSEPAVLDPAFQHMYLAVIRLKLGDITAGVNEWQRALDVAALPRSLIGLAEYAEKMGQAQVADSAYARLILKQPGLKSAYLERFQLAQDTLQTAKAHDQAMEIMRLWPEDDATHMREIYLRLLLASEPADFVTAETEAIPFLQRNPWDGSARSAVAFAQFKQGRAAEALKTLTEFTPGIPSSAISQAVYAAALAANGWKDKAKEQAQQLATENILPEERALITPILTATAKG